MRCQQLQQREGIGIVGGLSAKDPLPQHPPGLFPHHLDRAEVRQPILGTSRSEQTGVLNGISLGGSPLRGLGHKILDELQRSQSTTPGPSVRISLGVEESLDPSRIAVGCVGELG